MKRNWILSLCFVLLCGSLGACAFDETGDACTDGVCDRSAAPDAGADERISLPEPSDEGEIVDAEQEFWAPGEQALWCGGPCGVSDPNGSYICCYGKTCMSNPGEGAGPGQRCCYAMVLGDWGYNEETYRCSTHISCYREDGAKLHPGQNLKCNDDDDPKCTVNGTVYNMGQDKECGTPDDVALTT